MKKALSALLAVILVLSVIATATINTCAANNSVLQYRITAKEGLNVRSGPGTNYKKVGAIRYHTAVTVTAVQKNWGYIGTGWICLDYAKQISASTDNTSSTSGIPASAYKKAGTIYTIGGTSYYQALTSRDYNGVVQNTLFYVDKNGAVVVDAAILDRLYTLDLFNDIRPNLLSSATLRAEAATAYYDVCATVANYENLGNLIGKASGIMLNISAGNSFNIQDAVLEVADVLGSPEAIKTAVLLGLLQVYANNTVAYGQQAAHLMQEPVTDFETMIQVSQATADAAASFAVLEYLGGDTVREMATSSVGKELKKYLKNVFDGWVDTMIPDITAVQMTHYITEGAISLADFAVNSGAQTVYDQEVALQKKYLSATYDSAKAIADKLAEDETMRFVNPLTSKAKTNVVTQKWGAYYSGHGYHLGLDLGTVGNKSTTVGAIADGVVARVIKENKSAGWGNLVLVKHVLPNGKVFYSGYAHLKSISVSKGDEVLAGDKLGMMGNTGTSTGPHLHLLIYTGSLGKSSLPKGYIS